MPLPHGETGLPNATPTWGNRVDGGQKVDGSMSQSRKPATLESHQISKTEWASMAQQALEAPAWSIVGANLGSGRVTHRRGGDLAQGLGI